MSLTLAINLDKEKGTLNKEFEQWYNHHLNSKKTLLDALEHYENKGSLKDFPVNSSLVYKMSENLYFIPSTVDMYWLELDFIERDKIKNFICEFQKKMEMNVNYHFDYIFFDCPPFFTAFSYSVLNCSDMYLIPITPDVFASRMVSQMLEGFSKRIKPWPNPKISVFMNKAKTYRESYLTTESKKYLNDVKQVKNNLANREIKMEVFDNFIPEKIDILKAMPNISINHEFEETFHDLWEKISNFLDS